MNHDTPIPPPKVIIFDLLTALIDSWQLWNIAAGTSHSSPDPEKGLQWRLKYLDLTYGCGSYVPYESLVSQAAEATGLPSSAPENLVARWDELEPWPETPSVLSNLREKGHRMGVITNCSVELGRRAARIVEKAVGRGFQFDTVLTAEEVGFYKPRPETYIAVLEKMGARAEEAIFVAGSPADVPGARGVGMRVRWHNRVGLKEKDEGVRPEMVGGRLEDVLGDLMG